MVNSVLYEFHLNQDKFKDALALRLLQVQVGPSTKMSSLNVAPLELASLIHV